MPIATGAPVLLRRCRPSDRQHRGRRTAAWFQGTPAVLSDQRQPAANTINVVEAVKAVLPKLQASLPPPSRSRGDRPHHDDPGAAIADVPVHAGADGGPCGDVIFVFLRKFWAP